MKKHIYNFIIVITISAFQLACGQSTVGLNNKQKSVSNSEKRIENLKKQTEEFVQAQHDKNIEKLSKFIYTPNEVSGSMTASQIEDYRQRNALTILLQVQITESLGFTYEEKVEEPSEIVSVENKLFSIVPTSLDMKGQGKTCEGKRHWLAISQDNGENWGFFKGDTSFQKSFEAYFKTASEKIKLPEKKDVDCVEQ